MLAKKIRDGRRTARRKVLTSVDVAPGKPGGATYSCILKDLSDSGCQLVGSNTELLNEYFYLKSTALNGERKCRVVWRAKRMIGAIFVEA